MTAQSDPYVRVYYRIIHDDRFEHIYPDDHALATWVRLLLLADAMHPAPAPLPGSVRRAALKALTDAGIVELVPPDHYRIHGLAAERERQSQRGKAGASARWSDGNANAMRTHSDGNAGPQHDAMHSAPLRSSPLRSAPRDARAPVFDVIEKVESLTQRPFCFTAGSKVWTELEQDVSALGAAAVIAAYEATVAEASRPLDVAGVVYGGHKRLYPIPSGPAPSTAKAEDAAADFDKRVAATRARNADLLAALEGGKG